MLNSKREIQTKKKVVSGNNLSFDVFLTEKF